MREPHHLANAPIREALIEISVQFPEDLDPASLMDKLLSLSKEVASEYPVVEPIFVGQVAVDIAKGESKLDQGPFGFRCFNSQRNRAVQFRKNGFTMNWLRPYSDWHEFREVASKMWSLYRGAVQPSKIARLSVRYINDLQLPLPFESFGEYLVSDPIIPKELPQGVFQFLTRVTIASKDSSAIATITQAYEGAKESTEVNVIFDIATYIQREFDPEDTSVWSSLDSLRDFKNLIFFSSLTEKALRMFDDSSN